MATKLVGALEQVLRIYQDAAELYERVAPALGKAALGYEVLYGPPVKNPPMLFVGYQPGGSQLEPLPVMTGQGGLPPWPTTVDFARVAKSGESGQPFKLARRLQEAFSPEFLGRCTGLNAVFLRSPRMDTYAATVPAEVRAEYKAFGTKATQEIIEILQPRIIVAIGFATMRLFAPDTNVVLRGEANRALLSSNNLNGMPLFGMRHPTGSKPPQSNEDMKQIGAYLQHQLEPTEPAVVLDVD